MQHTRDTSGTVEVDGETYEWEIRRQPQPKAGGQWEGMALSLRLKDFPREAIVQFPMPMRANGRPDHEKQRINGGGLEPDLARQGGGLRRGRRRPLGRPAQPLNTRKPASSAMASISVSPEVSP